jgi:hypothetical protein
MEQPTCRIIFNKLITRVIGLSLCMTAGTAAALPVNIAPYAFSMDRFEVVGNSLGSFVDEFDTNALDPSIWAIRNPTVVESGGVVTFSSPGTVQGGCGGGYCVSAESSGIALDYTPAFGGQGDFTWNTAWLPSLPEPNQFYGMSFSYQCAPGVSHCDGGVGMLVGNAEGSVAQALGVSSGLNVWFIRGTSPSVLHPDVQQAAAISSGDITGEILLKIAFDDNTDVFSAAYSLDGGTSFQTPFSPIETGPIGLGIWTAGAQSWGMQTVPEPSSLPLLGLGIVGLIFMCRRKATGTGTGTGTGTAGTARTPTLNP